jgi:hypothetical protein
VGGPKCIRYVLQSLGGYQNFRESGPSHDLNHFLLALLLLALVLIYAPSSSPC